MSIGYEANVAFLGIDPGPTTGIVLWLPGYEPHVIQCNARASGDAMEALLHFCHVEDTDVCGQIERWVTRKVSAKAGANGTKTRQLISDLSTEAVAHVRMKSWRERSASEVKPWAMDERLDAAGLLSATKGMPHARDAARHSIFTAVRDGGIPDPLSPAFQRRFR
jgi:hypothetical protein